MVNKRVREEPGVDPVGDFPGTVPNAALEAEGLELRRNADGAYLMPVALRKSSPAVLRALQRAQLAVRRMHEARADLDDAVAAMRAEGASWYSVGWAVGISAQAAQKRWSE